MISALHIYRTYYPEPPGGIQEAIRQIALAANPEGVRSTIFTLSPTPYPETLGLPEGRVVRCRSWGAPASCNLGGAGAFSTFARLAAEADLLHYYFPWPFADLLHAVKRSRTPAIMTYVSDIVRQRRLGALYAPLMWRTLRDVRLVVASSPTYVDTSAVLSRPEIRRKVRIIPFGIDESRYPEGDKGVLSRTGIATDEPFFLFLGALRYYKGTEFLLQAAARVGAKIVIAGSGPEGRRLHSLRTKLGADNIIFAGQVTVREKVALLQHCRALVLPSYLRSEAYGMVLVEAAMYGRPMITCDIGTGTSFVNVHEETGFVVQPESAEELSAAMNQLLLDEALVRTFGGAARARYERLFSGSRMGKAYAEVFREVCG